MCSTSNVNAALGSLSDFGTGPIQTVPAHKVKKERTNYFVVDVREAFELEANTFDDADIHLPLGAICHDATTLFEKCPESKTIVLVCATGSRAEVALQSVLVQKPTSNAAVLQRGLVGWENAAAVVPDFVVVLGVGDSTEKLSLSLSAVASAVDQHQDVVLVLMSDGVNWFIKSDSPKVVEGTSNVETVSQGAPFKPCKAMLNKFLSNGGVILACTTCVKHRGCAFGTDMMDCVSPLQMPDLVRMLGEAKSGSMQFM